MSYGGYWDVSRRCVYVGAWNNQLKFCVLYGQTKNAIPTWAGHSRSLIFKTYFVGEQFTVIWGKETLWCCGGTCLDSINHKESSGGKYMETSVCRCKRRTVVMGRDREDMDTGSGIWMVDVSGTWQTVTVWYQLLSSFHGSCSVGPLLNSKVCV